MKLKKRSMVLLILALLLELAGEAHAITGATEEALEKDAEEAFPDRTGEPRKGLFETPWGDVELEYQVIDGQPVFEGDILLPAEAGSPHYEVDSQQPLSAVVSALGRRWPHGIVPVEDSGLARDARVTQAIQRDPALASSHVAALRDRGDPWQPASFRGAGGREHVLIVLRYANAKHRRSERQPRRQL